MSLKAGRGLLVFGVTTTFEAIASGATPNIPVSRPTDVQVPPLEGSPEGSDWVVKEGEGQEGSGGVGNPFLS